MSIIDKIEQQLAAYAPEPTESGIGTVVSVGDGVAEIEGLPGAVMSEMIEFETGGGAPLSENLEGGSVYGVVLNLERHSVKAVVLGDSRMVREGAVAKSTGKILSIPVGEAMLGRVVNALAEPVDGLGPIAADATYAIERPSYGVIDRASVNTPLHTGIKAIDAMTPIGRGHCRPPARSRSDGVHRGC